MKHYHLVCIPTALKCNYYGPAEDGPPWLCACLALGRNEVQSPRAPPHHTPFKGNYTDTGIQIMLTSPDSWDGSTNVCLETEMS